jgi:voltage-gated potassium channel Kch
VVIIRQLIEGGFLVAATVAIHAAGAIGLLWFLAKYRPIVLRRDSVSFSVMRIAWIVSALILVHLAEIATWALFYDQKGLFPDFETAAYYSLATYTTVGYGDVVLPREWRLEGASEALVGILMTAWSTALLIGVVNKFHGRVMSKWDPVRDESQRHKDASAPEGAEGRH